MTGLSPGTGERPPREGVGGRGNFCAIDVADNAVDALLGDAGMLRAYGRGEGVGDEERSLLVLGSVCSDTASNRLASLRDSGKMGLPSCDDKPRPTGAPPDTPNGNDGPPPKPELPREGAEGVFCEAMVFVLEGVG